jgi:hypothetical protein
MLSLKENLKNLNEKIEKANKLEDESCNLMKERNNVKSEIEKIDNLINEKVHTLYGLNEKEIELIEK